ncbi:MAG: TIGR04255 family protein [Melioribacteraceae bacterium]
MYKKNFINRVILRLDFAVPFRTTPDFLNKVKTTLTSDLTNIELKIDYIKSIEANISEPTPTLKIETQGVKGTFNFDTQKERFIIEPNALILESSEYTSFKNFFDKFKIIFRAFDSLTNVEDYNRVGLRFVNIFRDLGIKNIQEWDKFIHKDYIPNYRNISFLENNFQVRRNTNDFYWGNGNYLLHLKNGIWNSQFPSIITEQEFIVDLDCYLRSIISKEQILSKPEEMDHIAYQFFDSIITDELKTILGTSNER